MISKPLLIQNVRIFTSTNIIENGWLIAENGKITNLGVSNPPFTCSSQEYHIIEGNGLWLTPGFVDVHVHGALGYEAMDGTAEALAAMSLFYAKHGVTGFLPTTWAADILSLKKVLVVIKQMMQEGVPGAAILGCHLEGPFINAAKAGAQNPEAISVPVAESILPLLDMDVIKLITLAPELPGNDWLIRECVRRGITVSAGHTNATFEQMQKAVAIGIRHVTHTFNAMQGLHHREPGTAGAALSLDELTCELIADGIHVHPAMLKIAFRAKTNAQTVLVTDAMRGTGLPDGEYPIDDRIVTIQNGAARLPGGQLAGSTLTLDLALKNMITATGAPLEVLLPTVTMNPAATAKISRQKGSIAIGKDADLVLLDSDIKVHMTIISGKIITG